MDIKCEFNFRLNFVPNVFVLIYIQLTALEMACKNGR